MSKLIGRKKELETLQSALISDEPELIALYGRRRIGKTFLISNGYRKEF
jgi:AAA+ ATPase superfamily predicted ATPase